MGDSKMTRRDFAGKAAKTAAAGLALASGPAIRNVLGANNRIGLGLIGAGDQGRYDLKDFMRTGQVDVIAVADPHQLNLDQAVEMTEGKAKAFKDFRGVLDRKDIDAVLIATPDHWHAIPMIAACAAGKDIYQEKPLSHTLYEGKKMIEAATAHNRVVQIGTQQRSGEHFQKAVELVQSGKIGKVCSVDTWIDWNTWPRVVDPFPDDNPPAWLDWDLWLGPAPYHRYNPARCLQSFRWYWDYANGMATDWGTHLLDIALWGMGVDAPKTVCAMGGKYLLQDDTETPDTLNVIYEFPASPVSGKDFIVTFTSRFTNQRGTEGHSNGIEFFGTEGTLLVDRGGFTVWPEPKRVGGDWVDSSAVMRSDSSAQHYPHVLNFLECVKSRQTPHSSIESGHRATSMGLLACISLKLGRKLVWDGQRQEFPGDVEANRLITKEYRKPWIVA